MESARFSIRRGLCLLALLGVLPAAGQQRTELVLGTATAGGGFVVYGEALAAAIAAADASLAVHPRRTAGSVENIELLAAAAIDMALVQGETVHQALRAKSGTAPTLRIVAAMYPTAGMFVVRADSPYRRIEDLRGQPVAFGARGSGLVALARYVLDGMDLDMDRDFVPVLLDRAGGSGWPVFAAAMKAPGGGRFLAPDRKQIAGIRQRHPFLQAQTLPADSFPGQPVAVESVGSWSFILARQDLPEEVVLRFCRALHARQARLAASLPQARDTTAANTAAAAPPEFLHPGTRRCLEELGLLR